MDKGQQLFDSYSQTMKDVFAQISSSNKATSDSHESSAKMIKKLINLELEIEKFADDVERHQEVVSRIQNLKHRISKTSY